MSPAGLEAGDGQCQSEDECGGLEVLCQQPSRIAQSGWRLKRASRWCVFTQLKPGAPAVRHCPCCEGE
jgi:hypothetical protein